MTEKYERDAKRYWDIFYKRHQDKVHTFCFMHFASLSFSFPPVTQILAVRLFVIALYIFSSLCSLSKSLSALGLVSDTAFVC